jgi:hypothetical protein
MNKPKICQLCGETFYPDQPWKTLCIPCFKISKQRENESTSELEELRSENFRLRYQLAIARPSIGAIPRDILKSLIRLAHPDRHNGSQAANDATAWLLSQRDQHD